MTTSIQPLHCGTLTAGRSMFEAGADDERITIPVPSWLIRHPSGNVLVDCGMNADLTSPGDYLDTVSLFFDVAVDADHLVGGALRAAEVDPADLDVVILTHLHFDHAGGLGQIPNARVIVQHDEWSAGADPDMAAANSFVQSDFLLGHDVLTPSGAHDVFGDAVVTCLPTPGHTPGHQSVRVRLADREVVLCGDCAYFERTLDGGSLPGVGHDLAAQADSIRGLQALRAAGAHLIPGHDADTFAALPQRIS